MVCATPSTLIFIPLPIFLLPMLIVIVGFTTALSVKFNLEGKKNELKSAIDQLDKIQNQLDYVVSCNGTFDAEQYKQLLPEPSYFAYKKVTFWFNNNLGFLYERGKLINWNSKLAFLYKHGSKPDKFS